MGGNTYSLPGIFGDKILVPTVPPLVYKEPGYSDQILTPGTQLQSGDGGRIEVTQDGVLRVTSPNGNQVDYVPGSAYTFPSGGTISVLAPPQALNLNQNPESGTTTVAEPGLPHGHLPGRHSAH